MNIKLGVALGLLVLGVLCGCWTPEVSDPRVVVDQNIRRDISVVDVRCAKGAGSYMMVQANVCNDSRHDVRLEWCVRWVDAQGMEIESLASTWQRLVIVPNDMRGLKGTAPSLDAADMRILIRRMRE